MMCFSSWAQALAGGNSQAAQDEGLENRELQETEREENRQPPIQSEIIFMAPDLIGKMLIQQEGDRLREQGNLERLTSERTYREEKEGNEKETAQ